jgi:hypothetical protein
MPRYIGEYCKTCDLCLQTKAQKQLPMGELKLLPIPEGCWDVASVDFIVELPESQGHDAIMVVVELKPTQRLLHLEPHGCIYNMSGSYMDSHRQ